MKIATIETIQNYLTANATISRINYTACADFPTGVELADDTTALLIYCHACHAHIHLLIFLQ